MTYDVFISYKQSNETGELTEDYEMARQLFEALVSRGYHVFFSAESLEQIGSSRYKADIDEALDSSKSMIVVLSQADYANTQWVKYEWDSFYNDFLSGMRKEANLFTLTEDFDITTLPRTLRNLQHFYLSEGIDRVCDYIERVIPNQQKKTVINNAVESPNETNEVFKVITGRQVTMTDIEQACLLDRMVYSDDLRVEPSDCEK